MTDLATVIALGAIALTLLRVLPDEQIERILYWTFVVPGAALILGTVAGAMLKALKFMLENV